MWLYCRYCSRVGKTRENLYGLRYKCNVKSAQATDFLDGHLVFQEVWEHFSLVTFLPPWGRRSQSEVQIESIYIEELIKADIKIGKCSVFLWYGIFH